MRKYAYGYKDLKDLERGLEDERSRVRVESALGIIFRVSYDEGPTYLEHFLKRRGHQERLVGALLSAFEANEESLLLEAGQGLASLGTDALSRLCELYEDVHMRTQYWIVRALGGVQTDEPCVLSCLRAALHSDDEYLRLEAIKTIGKLGAGGRTLVKELVRRFDGANSSLRWAIVFALGRSTSRSRDVQTILKRGLRDEDASVRSASAQAISLHQKNGGNLIPALFHALKKEHHHDALNEMLRALQKWPAISQRVSDVLLGFLHHPDEGLQRIAIRQCTGFFPLSEELCERLLDIAYHHASPGHRRDAVVALFFGPPSFQQTLLEKTLDILCKQKDDARQSAAFVLHCSGYGAAPLSTYIVAACGDSVDVGELHLLQALQHVEKPPKGILSWVRKRFAQANVAPVLAYPEYVFPLLEKMDPADLVDLVGQLYDEVRHVYFSNDLVASFLRILGRIGPASEEIWPILTHFIEGGECSEELCVALASFGERALPLLFAFMGGRKEREVVSALQGLAKLGNVATEHFSEVWALRSAKSRAVRAAACAACLEIDEERAFALGVLDDLSCASCGPVVARHMSREGLLSTWSDWEDFLQRGDCSFQARVEASILSEWFEREEQRMFVVEAALHALRLSSVSNTQIEVLLLPVLESLRTSHQPHGESFLYARHVVRAVSLSHRYIAQYSEKGERVKRVFSWLDGGLRALASGEREELVEFAREAVSLYKLHIELHPVRGKSAKKEWLRQWKSVCAGWERHKARKGSVSVSQEAWKDVLFGG